MKRFDSHTIGIDQGSAELFSDFEDDGQMWSGQGPRVNRTTVRFSDEFVEVPSVTVGLAMFDIANAANARVDIRAENITARGFEIAFRTWEDTQVARVRATWQAIGPLRAEDNWDI